MSIKGSKMKIIGVSKYNNIHQWLIYNHGNSYKCENKENKFLSFECSEISNRFEWALSYL